MDHGIDWYSISKMSHSNFDLDEFKEIVTDSQPHQGIDRVSLQYRKKLLIMFQEASKMIKMQIPNSLASNSELQIKKSIVADNLHSMESEVQSSFKQISNLKMIVAEKKRLLVKLKEKASKLSKKNAKRVYVCTLCQREEFQSFQAFKLHIDTQHQETLMNKSEGYNQMNDFKELLMTMKDKEIEMMSMFLKASREFQTEQLGKTYDKEYKKIMQISGAQTQESKEEVEPEELKSQSQFLFFQKSDQFRREMERDQEFRRKIKQQKSQQQTLSHEFYQPNNYYNVFGAISQNSSEHVQESNRRKLMTQEKQEKSYGYYDPAEFLSKFYQRHPTVQNQSRCSLVEETPKPYVELKQSKMKGKEEEYVAPSISDRLRLQKNKKSTHYDTMYSTKRKFYEQKGYAFNSGPLLDDKGEGSDYQDYFGKDKTLNISIQDEEIKLNQMNLNSHNDQTSGKDSFYLSKLLSPKNLSNNSLLDKSIKEKSSELIDFEVSDSFSKRDFEISKDDETINLSDLKLSKLQKKKAEENLLKINPKDKKKVDQILIQEQPTNTMKRQQKDKTVELLLQYEKKSSNTVVTSPCTNILKEFQKQIPSPLIEQSRPSRKGNKREIDQFIRK